MWNNRCLCHLAGYCAPIVFSTLRAPNYFELLAVRSQEELVDDIPESIAEEPAHTLPHAQTVPPSPVVESLAQLTVRCRSQSSYFNQAKSKCSNTCSSEKIELKPLVSEDATEKETLPSEPPMESSSTATDATEETPPVTNTAAETVPEVEIRSRSVEDLPQKPKSYVFRDSKSSAV
ncbi:hypothetical protein AVEN_200485-1 [Araneus ventricosus]|uniref:Uncharacterized protein n=1 Tax=Araneus ventricosus TaxID=182803 RepID=A0A4Y2V1Q4_ARAVE|nr:hypothetical protein AVEN_249998-1 [Araneus ventricosus]GBO17836.1 hypothetical protein AVEN_200485-1 [Araneus ventricosus]